MILNLVKYWMQPNKNEIIKLLWKLKFEKTKSIKYCELKLARKRGASKRAKSQRTKSILVLIQVAFIFVFVFPSFCFSNKFWNTLFLQTYLIKLISTNQLLTFIIQIRLSILPNTIELNPMTIRVDQAHNKPFWYHSSNSLFRINDG